MSFFKNFVNKFNKKQNISTRDIKFEETSFNYEEKEWSELQDFNNGWDQGDSTPFKNEDDQLSELIIQEEISEETSNSIINQESQSNDFTLKKEENLISKEHWLIKFSPQIFIILLLVFCNIFLIRLFLFFLFFYSIKNHILQLRLSEEKKFTYKIDPFEIMFSQANINSFFQNGYSVEDMIVELVIGSLKIEDVPIIRVCIIDSTFYTCDNRRLYAFQTAMKLGLKRQNIPILVVRVEDSNIKWKLNASYKVVKNTTFNNITLTEFARNGVAIDEKGIAWGMF